MSEYLSEKEIIVCKLIGITPEIYAKDLQYKKELFLHISKSDLLDNSLLNLLALASSFVTFVSLLTFLYLVDLKYANPKTLLVTLLSTVFIIFFGIVIAFILNFKNYNLLKKAGIL